MSKVQTKPVPMPPPIQTSHWDVPFEAWHFLWPPRPETVINAMTINRYERLGWIAQFKFNGTCSIIGISPTGEMHTFTRHGEVHKRWAPTLRTRALADYCPKGVWTVFLAELLNDKTPTIKDTLYIFDMIVANSNQLIGTTFAERQVLISEMFPDRLTEVESHFVITPNIWIAKSITSDFSKLFEDLKKRKDPAREGLVLKDPTGKLGLMFKTGNNQAWQVKVRIAD